jgi:hypothetical protein
MNYDEKSSGGKELSLDLLLLLTAFRILSAATGMVGAVCFQPGLVGLAMLTYFVDIYFVLFLFDYFQWLAPLSLLFVYPHVFFIKEALLYDKTMTRARYQPHGCCPSPL